MQRNAFSPFLSEKPRQSCVEGMVSLLCDVNAWRMRLIELAFASVIFFWLGFMIASRCL